MRFNYVDSHKLSVLRLAGTALAVTTAVSLLLYVLASAYVLRQAENNIESLLLSHKGIHHYVQKIMHPALYQYKDAGAIPKDFYAPELFSSSFIVRNQHQYYNQEREALNLPSFYYKMAAINPRNPVNKADPLEEKLIAMFNEHREVKKYREVLEQNDKKYLYVALPFLENNKNCLVCHGRREDSPAQLQDLYRGEGGFNEKAGDIRAIISIRMPLEHEFYTIYIVVAALGSGIMALLGLLLFNRRLRTLVAKSTASLVAEIEERKKLGDRLRQAQKMEAIGTLAGGIAHDFNNLLTPILGYAELGVEALPPGSKLRANQEQIVKAGTRAKELVKQILAFSRQTELERQPLHLETLLKEVVKLLRATIPTTIEFKIAITPGCRPVIADPTQLHQVIVNLCTNAYQAMRADGGTLALSLAPLELGPGDGSANMNLPPGHYLKLEVSDTGPGITPEIKERIYDPYFTTKAVGEGTGMGLAVVHGIVKSHHGHIACYSEPGRGTTFLVYLPTTDSASKPTATATPPATELPLGQERILIIDDEESVLALEKFMLESLGYTVTTAPSSIAGLAIFTAHPNHFDLVLTDMTMPQLTGIQLAQKMLAIRPKLPIILCTGFSETLNASQAKALGIKEYVMKPITRAAIAHTLRQALEQGN